MLRIRREKLNEHAQVEAMIRSAFYNLYMPGCVEHYLAHVMRRHKDFVPELDLVLELDGRLAGSIMYTKAQLTDEAGREKEALTFGPVCILPEYQRRGYGKMLIQHSMALAVRLGFDAVVIFGSPSNYVGLGFQSCKRYGVCMPDGVCPAAMLVKELLPGALAGHTWIYRDSPVMHIDEQEALRFDSQLAPMEKKHMPSQEEFYILSHAVLPWPSAGHMTV